MRSGQPEGEGTTSMGCVNNSTEIESKPNEQSLWDVPTILLIFKKTKWIALIH